MSPRFFMILPVLSLLTAGLAWSADNAAPDPAHAVTLTIVTASGGG